jgi:VIT1/CCC1 family predicted Fe2+/Mn2+ transporter
MGITRLATYFKSFVFGVEDSLVSTVGLLSGVALAGVPAATVILTGLVLIFVEAFSMAAGEFLSERSTEEFVAQGEVGSQTSLVASGIMFVSYLISGFIPLAPYFFLPTASALPYSIGGALLALFILGAIGARVTKTHFLMHGIQMLAIGGAAILVGILAGQLAGV